MPAGKSAAARKAGPAGKAGRGGFRYVRPAGPETMRDPPDTWDRVDEAVDASFPGSDPPALGGITGTAGTEAEGDADDPNGQPRGKPLEP